MSPSSQSADHCTLNLSLSNNRSPFICLLKPNVDMTDLLWKENTSDILSVHPTAKRHSKLLVLIKKYKCLPLMQTKVLRICLSPNTLLREYTAVLFCISSTDICQHKRRLRKKVSLHISREERRSLERHIILLWSVNQVFKTRTQCTPTTRGFHRLAASWI